MYYSSSFLLQCVIVILAVEADLIRGNTGGRPTLRQLLLKMYEESRKDDKKYKVTNDDKTDGI